MRGLRSLQTKGKPEPPEMLEESQGGCVWRQSPRSRSPSGSWWGLVGLPEQATHGDDSREATVQCLSDGRGALSPLHISQGVPPGDSKSQDDIL